MIYWAAESYYAPTAMARERNDTTFNSLWTSEDMWRRRYVSIADQVMAWHLFGTKPFPELIAIYRPLDS